MQGDGEQLLGHQVARLGRREDRLGPAARPQQQQTRCLQQRVLAGGEEQAVAYGAGAAAGAADALQERGDGGR
ncbi:hypothetical protein GCM10010269_65290 [Streptomyces humidus]|uniref:Uncharacterized protein n=1 Tax=Streptomyces humidus TaxID=52259 RepID=A0A918G3I0_9ACTN|nr:hypothetical protein GCM10010269_65290 [Streptomyces humidus]